MEEAPAKPKRPLFIYLGLLFLVVGGLVFAYYYFGPISSGKGWVIEIEGNQTLSKKEIRRIVTYLIQDQQEGITPGEIEEALKLNPRIAKAEVRLVGKKRLEIVIDEDSTAYLLSHNTRISEMSNAGTILQEEVTTLHENLPADMPIFYLTGDQTMRKEVQLKKDGFALQHRALSDIISLWQKSRVKYAFLWQRIAEIELNLSKSGATIIYPAHVRAKIVLNDQLDMNMLERLWALFFYLEKRTQKFPEKFLNSWFVIEIEKEGAMIRRSET